MTVMLALAMMGLMAWQGPHLGLRLLGGRRGVLAGGLAALALAPLVGYGLALATSSMNGRPLATEFEATMNAWGLALFLTGAICLHLIGKLRRARIGPRKDNRWHGTTDSGSGDSHGGADGDAGGDRD